MGEKIQVDPDSQARTRLPFKDFQFIILGLIDANGQSFLCVIILACKVLKME